MRSTNFSYNDDLVEFPELPPEVGDAILNQDFDRILNYFYSRSLDWGQCEPSPLYIALGYDLFNVADFLLNLGLDVNENKNLLIDILKSEIDEFVYQSTELKADVKEPDVSRTQYLLEKGIHVNNVSVYPHMKETPLDYAIRNRHFKAAALIKEHGGKSYNELS